MSSMPTAYTNPGDGVGVAEVAGFEKKEKCEDLEVAHTQRNDEDAEVDGSCGGACHQPGDGPGRAWPPGYRIDVRSSPQLLLGGLGP